MSYYYEDKDDVQLDKDVLISYWSKRLVRATTLHHLNTSDKGYMDLEYKWDVAMFRQSQTQTKQAYPLSKQLKILEKFHSINLLHQVS